MLDFSQRNASIIDVFIVPDLRFFETLPPISIAEALAASGAKLIAGDPAAMLKKVSTHDDEDLCGAIVYFAKTAPEAYLAGRNFGLCLTTASLAENALEGGAVAAATSPRLAFARLSARLHRSLEMTQRTERFQTSVRVDETAVVAHTASIGDGVRIGPHAYIGPGVVLGEGCVVEAGAAITHTLLGANVSILSGARIGQAGFGFAESETGLVRVPQLGRVIIGDDVEIGANTTIDRGALGDTIIGEGSKIDNLVQIGHNVRIGRHCVLAAQTGVSGSCIIGDGVFMGGQVGLADHLIIGDGAQIAAGAGLMRNVPPGEKWGGRPARPAREWLKEMATLAKIAKGKTTGKT